jgi:hypothetical protein
VTVKPYLLDMLDKKTGLIKGNHKIIMIVSNSNAEQFYREA